jgi:hypothetical protein
VCAVVAIIILCNIQADLQVATQLSMTHFTHFDLTSSPHKYFETTIFYKKFYKTLRVNKIS